MEKPILPLVKEEEFKCHSNKFAPIRNTALKLTFL